MTPEETVHWDVASYALGVLDAHDTAVFEEHLASCQRCADELEALLPTVALLSDVDVDALLAAEQSQLEERLWRSVAAERTRVSRRRALTLAAGVMVSALTATGALMVGASLAGGDPPAVSQGPSSVSPAPSPTQSDSGSGVIPTPLGERYSAADTTTGVRAELVLIERAWGTQLSFTLTAVSGPRICRLLVVHADGTAEVTGTWRVPEAGYGTNAQPEPLVLQASTAAQVTEIDRVQVQSLDDDTGDITTLVTIPISS